MQKSEIANFQRYRLLVASLLFFALLAPKSIAQAITEEVQSYVSLPPVLTHSPSDTLHSLDNLHDALIEAHALYEDEKSTRNYARIILIADALISLLDIGDENLALQRDMNIRTILALIDIIEDVDRDAFVSLPDRATAAEDGQDYYAVPGTPLQLQRMLEGPREGEYLFSSNSARIAPRYLREIAMQSPERLEDLWSTRLLQISGPLIPASVTNALPNFSRDIYWGTPLWKIGFSAMFLIAALLTLYALRRVLRARVKSGRMLRSLSKLLMSSTVFLLIVGLNRFFDYQLFLTGSFAKTETFFVTLAIYGALAWTFWNLMGLIADITARKRSASDSYYDESMMRLTNHIIALIGAIWILAYGAQTLGFPLLSILAGLGVGGLAVALAIRPTLENLISGFVLYIEKSVRVGDYCSFSGQSGTVERIGIRSTHVRALDRTLIAIPNSRFVDMELVNWAQCDQMLIHTVIGLRYETDTEQLHYVLAEIRRMMLGHPRINSDTARVRFAGYGDSSLDIDIRIYALTREWNDFYAIREDVLFRVKQIVEGSGTGFAFPSQTVYLSRDDGLDVEKSKHSIAEVGHWKRKREFPFPNFSTEERERLDGNLRYPPYGSPEYNGPDEDRVVFDEPLSAPDPEPKDQSEVADVEDIDRQEASPERDKTV
ncbi:mechanosensitive ion channel family protein [Ruegeria profundi]|uniref:Mechanosensitive ion channel protein MscS n=1 Tax=Ruegeria profundi TaxID=1685378 RepID=A0A0X3TU87_9RHOB|nr:mechanosensitive ion channel family protein [Ruegeria profundi]KUJ79247.1 hypothetical protein AVO44_08395 [Ruegeria profundi]